MQFACVHSVATFSAIHINIDHATYDYTAM